VVNLLQNGTKTANINVSNVHRSFTTAEWAQNDTSKTAKKTDTIFNGKGLQQSTLKRIITVFY